MDYIIALGANLGDRELAIQRAIGLMRDRLGEVIKQSTLRETEPLLAAGDDVGQPKYLNGAVIIRSKLEPQRFLEELLQIEKELGRTRTSGARWEARTIDLDVIAAGDRVINTPTLTVPHPEMHRRDFVLAPLVEIAPDWRHPLLHKTATELLDDLSN